MNDVCSHERLERALAGLLNADDESALHLHLNDCELCSAEIERLAGGEPARQEIASMLIPDELDDALPLREDFSTADFVVEHLEPSDDPTVLGRIGAYDVLDVIGRGGMGVVLRGFDRELKRFVAIKALAPHLAHSALARKRFAREAQAAAAVVNPHVIAIHQVQPNGQLPFLVMPLVNGESLAERLMARGTLELTEILRIGMQAADGLAAAHAQGLIHRDIKPANLLLEKGVERVVLTDFGLARAADDVSMTRWGIIAGTPEYMSPEQARGETLDVRSDLFSFGCVLYEMATGVSPFRADSTIATWRRIVEEKPAAMTSIAPDLPPWFTGIVERLLSKDRIQRFSSAREVGDLLERCLSHIQQPTMVALPKGMATPDAKRSGRSPLFRRCLAAAFALMVVFAGVFIVLELDKGRLTIQCAADDVPIRIMQGDEVVKKLTVTKLGASVRVAAGKYVVEIDGVVDGIVVRDGTVTLQRGGVETVQIVSRAATEATRAKSSDSAASITDAKQPEPRNTFLKHPEQAKSNTSASPKFNVRVFVYRAESISGVILDHHIGAKEVALSVGVKDGVRLGHAFRICTVDSKQCVGVAKAMELERDQCIAKIVSIDQAWAEKSVKGLIVICSAPEPKPDQNAIERTFGKDVWRTESLENKLIRELLQTEGDQVQIIIRQED